MDTSDLSSDSWKTALGDLVAVLDRHLPTRWALIGGIAVSLVSEPRFTEDIDLIAIVDSIPVESLLAHFNSGGFVARPADPVAFAKKNRMLLLQHGVTGFRVDISLGILPFEIETTERAATVDLGGIQCRVASIEDLIIMKAVAGRPRDIEDIRTLVSFSSNFDRLRILGFLSQFSEALDDPQILERARLLLTE